MVSTTKPLQPIHKDLCGPIKVLSIEELSEKSWTLIVIRYDHGTELNDSNIMTIYTKYGVDHNFSAPRTHQQKGVSERKNRSLLVKKSLWISQRMKTFIRSCIGNENKEIELTRET